MLARVAQRSFGARLHARQERKRERERKGANGTRALLAKYGPVLGPLREPSHATGCTWLNSVAHG